MPVPDRDKGARRATPFLSACQGRQVGQHRRTRAATAVLTSLNRRRDLALAPCTGSKRSLFDALSETLGRPERPVQRDGFQWLTSSDSEDGYAHASPTDEMHDKSTDGEADPHRHPRLDQNGRELLAWDEARQPYRHEAHGRGGESAAPHLGNGCAGDCMEHHRAGLILHNAMRSQLQLLPGHDQMFVGERISGHGPVRLAAVHQSCSLVKYRKWRAPATSLRCQGPQRSASPRHDHVQVDQALGRRRGIIGSPMSADNSIPWRTACLFLGAGFSFEMGLPLVWDLTKMLKEWLTPAKLRELNNKPGKDPALPEEVCKLYDELHADSSLHYEQIAHKIQQARTRISKNPNPYITFAAFLAKTINLILYSEHKRFARRMDRAAHQLYGGLKNIADLARPLWAFTLNHDICTEIICDAHSIPWSNGVPADQMVEFLEQNRPDSERIRFTYLKRDQYSDANGFGSEGVNLVKLHGALDLFTYDDERTILYVSRDMRLARLERIYEHSAFHGADGERIHMHDELPLADLDGVMQFLRQTLLTGHKFDRGFHQHAPPEFLSLFARKLKDFTYLVSIGYSFGDPHVDDVIRAWLEEAPERRVVVVSPSGRMPPSLSAHTTQVELRPQSAVDFLAAQAGIVFDRSVKLEREVFSKFRNSSTAQEQLEKIIASLNPEHFMKSLFTRLAEMTHAGTMSDDEVAQLTTKLTDEVFDELERKFLRDM